MSELTPDQEVDSLLRWVDKQISRGSQTAAFEEVRTLREAIA